MATSVYILVPHFIAIVPRSRKQNLSDLASQAVNACTEIFKNTMTLYIMYLYIKKIMYSELNQLPAVR